MIWLSAALFPLLAALALAFRRTERLARRLLVPLSAVPALALVAEPQSESRLEWLLFGADFGFGELGRVMLFLTALVWTMAGIYATGYLAHDARRTRFFVFFALSMSGNLGLVMAQDLASFYMFFSLMTFSAYGLVVHNGDAQAYRAGRIYLVAAIFGEVCLLAAILLAVAHADTLLVADLRRAIVDSPLHGAIILLALIGFGVKAGAALVHFWLPIAHPVAPVPASAVLSGAMIKAGLIGWLHFLPLGAGAYPQWGAVLLAGGFAAAFGGAALGLAQRDPKTVLAYSSVSQVGVITAALGIGLMEAHLWALVLPAVGLFALNHALAKGALFLGVGVLADAATRRARGATLAALVVAALAIAGAPYTGGAIAKHAMKYAVTGLEPELDQALPAIMSLSSVATTVLLAHFVALVAHGGAQQRASGAGMAMLLPFGTLVACVLIAVPWSIAAFALEIDPEHDVWNALAPVAIGIALFALAARALRGVRVSIPPGDMVIALEWLARRLTALAARLRIPGPAAWQINLMHYIDALAANEARRDLSRRLELKLLRWDNAMLAFALLLLAFLAALSL